MIKTLTEIVEATGDPVLAQLLELKDDGAAMPVEVDAAAGSDEQVKAAFRALVVAAFDDESLDVATTLVRIKEILKSYEKLTGRLDTEDPEVDQGEPTPESLGLPAVNVAELVEEVRELRRCETARQVLDAAGIDHRELGSDRLRLLRAQADEVAMKALVESWPPYVRQPRRAPDATTWSGSGGRYPTSLDEFVSLLK